MFAVFEDTVLFGGFGGADTGAGGAGPAGGGLAGREFAICEELWVVVVPFMAASKLLRARFGLVGVTTISSTCLQLL